MSKTRICPDCDGTGEYMDGLYEDDCPTCSGTGVLGTRVSKETKRQKEIKNKMEFGDTEGFRYRGHRE